MATKARDLMETHVISVGINTPLIDVQKLFVTEEIHGAPVIDEDGALAGVITSSDLLRAVDDEHESARMEASYFRDVFDYSAPDWGSVPEDFQDRLGQLRAEDAMTPEVFTVTAEAPASRIARELRERRVHRVFVTDADRLVGVVSAFDLLRLIAD